MLACMGCNGRQKTLGFNAKAPVVGIVVPEGVRFGLMRKRLENGVGKQRL